MAYSYITNTSSTDYTSCPMGLTAANPTNSVRQKDRDNNQRQGSPHVFPDPNNPQDRRRSNKRSPDWITFIDHWKYGVCGVKP